MHKHFWVMAREIRAYCRETGLRVLAKDRGDLTCEFVTDCPEGDLRHREWCMRFADVSLTANDRLGGFDGLSEQDMIRITHPHLMRGSTGRESVAEALSAV